MEVELPLKPLRLKMKSTKTNFVQDIFQMKAAGNLGPYMTMLQDIKAAQRLAVWYSQLALHVTEISDTFCDLIELLLVFDWIARSPAERAAYLEFLLQFTFSHPAYFERIYREMMKTFLGPKKVVSASLEAQRLLSNAELAPVFDFVQDALRQMVEAHPTSISMLRSAMMDRFPHRVFSAVEQENYTRQILILVDALPALRKDALELIFDRLVQIDVELKFLRKSEAFPYENRQTPDQDAVFAMEIRDENEEKADIILSTVLDWMQATATRNAAQMEDVYKILEGVFDKLLLTTSQTKCAQWALFYLCSINQEFVATLLEHWFDIVQNPKYPQPQRQRACLYIASFASRATFIPEDVSQRVLNHMCNWMSQYLTLQGENARPEANTHLLFYSMFHAISYVLRHQHDILFDRVAPQHTIQELGIKDFVRSGFNPLRVCAPDLVTHFLDVMQVYAIQFTNVTQQNERLILPSKDIFGPNSLLSDFFPFDPYFLPRSTNFFRELYKFYGHQGKSRRRKDDLDGYSSEGETEMDVDLSNNLTNNSECDMEGEDTFTANSMMTMMDHGRGSMPKESEDAKCGSYDGSLSNSHSSVFSGGGGSHFAGAFKNSSPLTTPPSNGTFPSFGGPSPSPVASSSSNGFNLSGSWTQPRRIGGKRGRDEQVSHPSTPISSALMSPIPQRSFSNYSSPTAASPSGPGLQWQAVSTSTVVIQQEQLL